MSCRRSHRWKQTKVLLFSCPEGLHEGKAKSKIKAAELTSHRLSICARRQGLPSFETNTIVRSPALPTPDSSSHPCTGKARFEALQGLFCPFQTMKKTLSLSCGQGDGVRPSEMLLRPARSPATSEGLCCFVKEMGCRRLRPELRDFAALSRRWGAADSGPDEPAR